MSSLRMLLTLILLFCWQTQTTKGGVACGAPFSKDTTVVIERSVHIAPLGAEAKRYAYVPFDVPAGASRVTVQYSYDRASNTIDLGLFDARSPIDVPDIRALRGWSGGRRSEISISKSDATPGYTSGALPSGKWHVILGLYKIAESGADVAVKIRIERESAAGIGNGSIRPAAFVSGSKERSTAGPARRWYGGDLHMHTVHSDGNWTVDELAQAASAAQLDFISITDHNTLSHHGEIEALRNAGTRLLVMRGEEITTYGGHTNTWGLPSSAIVDFRVSGGDSRSMEQVAAEAHRLGALISINHPFALCGGCSWSYAPAANRFDAVEVWNGQWDPTDEMALEWWDSLLRAGARVTAIGSSDSHKPESPIGNPVTNVWAGELSQPAILGGIKQGNVFVVASREIVIELKDQKTGRLHAGDLLKLDKPGKVALQLEAAGLPSGAVVTIKSDGKSVGTYSEKDGRVSESVQFDFDRTSYVRAEVRSAKGEMLGFTNPVYVQVAGAAR